MNTYRYEISCAGRVIDRGEVRATKARVALQRAGNPVMDRVGRIGDVYVVQIFRVAEDER